MLRVIYCIIKAFEIRDFDSGVLPATTYHGDWNSWNLASKTRLFFFVILNECFPVKVVGEGKDEGSMLFLPPSVENTGSGKRNIDYYDKIRLVIDRLEERRSIEEGEIDDLYRTEVRIVSGDVVVSRPKRRSTRPTLGVSRPARTDGEIDTSWKDGRCLYPKRSSQVGARYQVATLPRAGIIEADMELNEPK
jgi:hypothetical protein